MDINRSLRIFLLAAGVAVFGNALAMQTERTTSPKAPAVEASLFVNLEWRNIGPANMAGRVADVEGVPGRPQIVYVGAASGGVWKTTDGGVTWKPIFDAQPVASVGDIALEPGNPEVIYVGTGESNPRNSVSFGNGVYKSTDGGETWTHLGLEDTRHISRIVINPRNPNQVYAGALGHVFGPNKERGVYLSCDGGNTWEKVLYTDERHGVADMDIDPQNPNILYAALWRFERKPWTFASGSEEGGIYRSVDGGKTWKKITRGLPRLLGRAGVKVAPGNPRVVYVIAESNEGTLFRSEDRGESFTVVGRERNIVSRGFYYADLRVDPRDENRLYSLASLLSLSVDGGKTFKRIAQTTHADYHALWIDPTDPARIWQGQDGGVAVSFNRGETWQYVNNIPLAQFYQVYADNREPFYSLGGGLQDNGTWTGPSRTREPFGIMNDDWRMISFGDGFHIVAHPDDPEFFLTESQGGNILRTNMKTREQQSVSPQPRRADGGPVEELKYRFNWNAPIVSSPFDPRVVYFAGNVVFRSTDFGLTWRVISPDLTTNDPQKMKSAGGPVWRENTTAEYHCTIISLKESPFQRGLLWAGTDDGNLQVTLDGGKTWENVAKNVTGIPPNSPVSSVEPSLTDPGVAYCSFDRHMFDDLRPHIFKTRDYGKTWMNISANLPDKAYVWVVREDLENPNLIYAGTELGLYASFNGGSDWIKLHFRNLPTVAVHDIMTHLRENDLILGTHGRSLWIFDDITPLQQLTLSVLEQPAYLFDIRPALRFAQRPTRYGIGDGLFQGPNPPYGALLTYYLKEKPAKEVETKLEVLDANGRVIRTLKSIPAGKGLNRTSWDLRSEGPRPRQENEDSGSSIFQGPQGPQVPPGQYTVRLTVGNAVTEKSLEVRLDPTLSVSAEELRLQHRYAQRLMEMQSYVNDALRAFDTLKDQVEERKKTIRTLGRNVKDKTTTSVDDHLSRIGAFIEELVRPREARMRGAGPKLMDRISSLLYAVDGVNAAPTQTQFTHFGELLIEFKAILSRVNEYFIDSVRELNSALGDSKIPPVVAPEPIRFSDIDRL